jgi:hypothetical protein
MGLRRNFAVNMISRLVAATGLLVTSQTFSASVAPQAGEATDAYFRREVDEIRRQAESQAKLDILKQGRAVSAGRDVFEIALNAGYTMEAAEMCGVPTLSLGRLISDFEHGLQPAVWAEVGASVAKGRLMRTAGHPPRFTVNDCVGIDRALGYYEGVFRMTLQRHQRH